MAETIARMLMILIGFAIAMLGIIYAIHTQDVYLGILIATGGVVSMYGVTTMSSYYWCHGPECHTYSTQDRVRGSKGSKVLRTRKIKQNTDREWYDINNAYNYFCSQTCQNDFWRTHM